MKLKKRYGLVLALKIVILLEACGTSQGPEHNTHAVAATDSTSTAAAFVREATLDHMAAMQLGRYASGQASDQRLKNYGTHMISFHRMALDRLKGIAGPKGILMPDTMSPAWQRLVTDLVGEGGNPFDSTYMSVMVKQEKKMINAYDQAAKGVDDQEIRFFAAAEKDSLFRHLDRMITLKDSINLPKQNR